MASKRLSIEEQIEKKEESIDLTKDEFLKLIKTLNDEEIGLNIMEILEERIDDNVEKSSKDEIT